MKIGWIGLGKLGLPCAAVLAQHFPVYGYDVSDHPWRVLAGEEQPNREEGLEKLLAGLDGGIARCDAVADVVRQADVVFVAVQTPHAPEYGGEQPMPAEARDFEYAYLAQACRDVARAARAQEKDITLAVVSTVLPGTTDRVIRPLLNRFVRLAYTPQFIAMGTTIADFTDPELVVCGTDGGDGGSEAAEALEAVFLPVHGESRLFYCDIATAEAVKVYYNTFISMKVVWANHVMELCQATGADCDRVVDALSRATQRVVSARYMRGGMGDGGACHPRDLIALAALEERAGTSYPLFWELARAREEQARGLAALVKRHADQAQLPVVLLGKSYKPESDLIYGSPALLLAYYLREAEQPLAAVYDPYSGTLPLAGSWRSAVYAITTRHRWWQQVDFPAGSVVIDPFGYIRDQEKVTVVRVGRR